MRRLRQRLGAALAALGRLTTLTIRVGVVALPALALLPGVAALPTTAHAAAPKTVTGKPGSIVAFAPASTQTYAWRPAADADVPPWLHALDLGNCISPAACDSSESADELMLQLVGASPGDSATFSVIEYTHSGAEVVYDLTVQVGAA